MILGINADATEKQVKDAYHILVKVWHPDRFQGDDRMREAAEAKLKEINSAFEFLRSSASKRPSRRQAKPEQSTSASSRPQPAEPTNSENWRPKPDPIGISFREFLPGRKMVLRTFALLLALLFARYLWIAFDVPASPDEEVERVYRAGKDTLLKKLQGPERRFVAAVEQDLRRLGIEQDEPTPVFVPQPAESGPVEELRSRRAPREQPERRAPEQAQTPMRKVEPVITIGSTKEEVLDGLGRPTESSENKLVYGRSELYFKDGAVVGWRIDPASSIRVKLWPQSPVDPDLTWFAVGSTKDAVLAVQGTPTAFSESKFEYGRSEVYFRNNRVVGWKNDFTSIPLRLVPQ